MELVRLIPFVCALPLVACRYGFELTETKAFDLGARDGELSPIGPGGGTGEGSGGEGPNASGGNPGSGGQGMSSSGGRTGMGGDGQQPEPALVFSLGPADSTVQHTTPSEDLVSDRCPDDQVIIGYDGWTGSFDFLVKGEPTQVPLVTSIQAVCGVVTVNRVAPHLITIEPGATLTEHGSPGAGADPSAFSAQCPADEVVIGFEGRAGLALDQLGWRCGSLSTDGAEVTVTPTGSTDRHGGDGGTEFDDACPTGSVARGTDASQGDEWLVSYGSRCGLPAVTRR